MADLLQVVWPIKGLTTSKKKKKKLPNLETSKTSCLRLAKNPLS